MACCQLYNKVKSPCLLSFVHKALASKALFTSEVTASHSATVKFFGLLKIGYLVSRVFVKRNYDWPDKTGQDDKTKSKRPEVEHNMLTP